MGNIRHPHIVRILLAILILGIMAGGYFLFRWGKNESWRTRRLISWIHNPEKHPDWEIASLTRCGNAPFIIPTAGYIGYIWGDSFRPGHIHQGIDIFSGKSPGAAPVFAAYPGYLHRLPGWKSSLIIRIPEDPLRTDHQIWLYYTHLADAQGISLIAEQYPPGTEEMYVEQGTFLGYQGNYSGKPGQPTGVHLHFSIVRDDGSGRFLNELAFENTLDPSPYFQLPLNAKTNTSTIPLCSQRE